MKVYLNFFLALSTTTFPGFASADKSSVRGLQGNGNGNGNGNGPPADERKSYMISFTDKDETSSKRCDALSKAHGGTTGQVYNKVLNGCSMTLPKRAAAALKKNSKVKMIEADMEMHAVQAPASWGLDRIDQCELPLSNSYSKVNATDTKVYILDTGIQGDSNTPADVAAEFNGVLDSADGCHASFIDGQEALADGGEHGTHVASTACGNTYGVASNCHLCAVKVLSDQGSGSTASVVAGIEHAVTDCGAGNQCVINMSLGGTGQSLVEKEAVDAAVAAGVTVVVAAGNSNTDACGFSPAFVPSAITVGATDQWDARSGFSNYGECLDVYAPGSSISAMTPNGSIGTWGGTSMASPHVAGIAAGILGSGAASDPAGVLAQITSTMSKVFEVDPNSALPLGIASTHDADCVSATIAPTISPKPTPAPTTLASCLALPGNAKMKVDITVDQWPGETTWNLVNLCGDQEVEVASGGSYGSTSGTLESTGDMCVDEGKYRFTINDSFGDGNCCDYGDGGYSVFMNDVEVASGGDFNPNFGSSESKEFGLCPGTTASPTSGPTNPPTYTPTNPPTTPPTSPPTSSPTKLCKVVDVEVVTEDGTTTTYSATINIGDSSSTSVKSVTATMRDEATATECDTPSGASVPFTNTL